MITRPVPATILVRCQAEEMELQNTGNFLPLKLEDSIYCSTLKIVDMITQDWIQQLGRMHKLKKLVIRNIKVHKVIDFRACSDLQTLQIE